jgi:Holliday junction resolvasome RuvABC endonuclease subunit
MNKTIMCSLDVSTKKTGIAVFCNGDYKKSHLLDHSNNSDTITRSMEMTRDIITHLNKYKPIIVSIEDTYCGNNADVMKKLCRIQGAIYGWCLLNGADFNIYLPSSWRKEFDGIFDGKKRAECKQLAIDYVKENYDLDVNNDEAEAILIGIATVRKYNR